MIEIRLDERGNLPQQFERIPNVRARWNGELDAAHAKLGTARIGDDAKSRLHGQPKRVWVRIEDEQDAAPDRLAVAIPVERIGILSNNLP
jgi:hypothetical protein